jgi:hypothetical protein
MAGQPRADAEMIVARAVALVLCAPALIVTGYACVLIFVFAAWDKAEFGGSGVWGIVGFIPLITETVAVICAEASCVKKQRKAVLILAGVSAALSLAMLLLVVMARVLLL